MLILRSTGRNRPLEHSKHPHDENARIRQTRPERRPERTSSADEELQRRGDRRFSASGAVERHEPPYKSVEQGSTRHGGRGEAQSDARRLYVCAG